MEPQAKVINFKKKTSALPDVFSVFSGCIGKLDLRAFPVFGFAGLQVVFSRKWQENNIDNPHTPRKFDVAPEKWWFGRFLYFPFGVSAYFQGLYMCKKFRGVLLHLCSTKFNSKVHSHHTNGWHPWWSCATHVNLAIQAVTIFIPYLEVTNNL